MLCQRLVSGAGVLALCVLLAACGGSHGSGNGSNAPVISTSSLPGGTVGSTYSAPLSASGGTAPFTWSISSGNLPPGLTLNANDGTISGTPTTSGQYSFVVKVSDANLLTGDATLSITIANALTITTTSLPAGAVGSPYTATLSASGGTPPFTWSTSSGSLPPGLSLGGSTGQISGSPMIAGDYAFVVQVSDANSKMATANLSITVTAGVISITTTLLPGGTVGASYSVTLSAAGGLSPYVWNLAAGSLPAGLTLTSSGAIAGIPTTVGTTNFTVQVQDSETPPVSTTADLSITIAASPTFTVIKAFSGGADGDGPVSGLTMDQARNLYGVTDVGGTGDWGTAYRLTPSNGGWTHSVLYNFAGGNDGAQPQGRLAIGADGSLYGTTVNGGQGCLGAGCGTAFNLKPSISGDWMETVLYRFTEAGGGYFPNGDVILDQAGNLYGTTGGGDGVVYQLTPSNGNWTESILFSFDGGNDGSGSGAGLVFDNSGNLYGTTGFGGSQFSGTVFQLAPSGSGWTENVLYNFQHASDGNDPECSLIFDASGNLYGTTSDSGTGGGGTAFKLTPANNGWDFTLIYGFTGPSGSGPQGGLTLDANGNLYGATYTGGAYGYGAVFKLTPWSGGWTYTSLHDFTGGSDGGRPSSNVLLDSNGVLYGTAPDGGNPACDFGGGCGVVWEVTP
jgi:uncharacterized repeat protein (TIGR03803 family)